MSEPSEGARVSYIGQDVSGPELGTQGRLLAITGSAGHVKWDDGPLAGRLTLTSMADLVSITSRPESITPVAAVERDVLDDSLEFGHTATWTSEEMDVFWDDGSLS
jgi:hypothetical protein